jgi:hypothetical protein
MPGIRIVPISNEVAQAHVEASIEKAISTLVGKKFGVDIDMDGIKSVVDAALDRLPSEGLFRDEGGQFWEVGYVD